MPLNLAPEIEDAVRERAAEAGATPTEYLARLLNVSVPAIAPNINATEALFRQWDAEDANMMDAEREEEDQFWEKFAHNIDEERRTAGMRLLFCEKNKCTRSLLS